jgi:ABC-type glycerol-3-phosphate transport system substrate-binding protein
MDGVAKWYPAWNRSAVAFKHGEEADKATVDFIRYLTNAENSVKFCMAVGSLTPYKDAAELQAYKDYLNKGDLMTQSLQAVQATLEYAEVLPTVTVSSTVRTELQRAVERVATGTVTAEEALKEAAENANREWAAK